MVEKLTKALEGLKNLQFSFSVEDSYVSKKEKMCFCAVAVGVILTFNAVDYQNLSLIIENLINLCDDKDSDIRMLADESLNRIIMSLPETYMLKVQVELHKIIAKNGPARCLRAALTRFGQLSHYIRPSKGKGHVQTLIPSLIEIAKREEESVHETLASAFEKIFKVLGIFVPDNSLKSLIKAFLHNMSSSNPVIRRCSASCIITVVQFCRKPHVFNSYILNSLLDCIIPVCENNSAELILGVLGCLRLLLPTLSSAKTDEGITGSFGLRQRQRNEETLLSVDRLIQVYELCIHYTNNKDHNVVAAALETLNQILQNPPPQLLSYLLSPAGFSRSYVHSIKENRLCSRTGSEISVTFSSTPLDENLLLEDVDITSQFGTFSPGERLESKQAVTKPEESPLKEENSLEEGKVESPFKGRFLGTRNGNQTVVEMDSDSESVATTSDWNPPADFFFNVEPEFETEDFVECSKSEGLEVENKNVEDFVGCSSNNIQDILHMPNDVEENLPTNIIDVGNFTDAAVPLIHCTRHLAASFLLEGASHCLKSDRIVRISVKSLTLSCLSAIVKLYPVVMKMSLDKSREKLQEISDVLLYSDHCDPQIRGCVYILLGNLINAALIESKGFHSHWLSEDGSKLNLKFLICELLKGLKDKSSVCTRQALIGVKLCINRALLSVYNNQFLPVLEYLPVLTKNSYWLVKVKLAEVFADLSYICIHELTKSNNFQEEVIDFVLFPLLGDEDSRVRLSAAEALVRIIPGLYYGKSTVLDYSKAFSSCLYRLLKDPKDGGSKNSACPPYSYLLTNTEEFDCDAKIEFALSRIIAKLTYCLLLPTDKHFLFGYLEALTLLSQKYPPTVYPKEWNCYLETGDSDKYFCTSSLTSVVLSLLVTSPLVLDLTTCSNATILLANLFSGHCIPLLKKGYHVTSDPLGEPVKLWDVFSCEQFSEVAEEMFTHVLKVLNLYSSLSDEISWSNLNETSSTFLPLLSPVKKQEKKSEDKIEEKTTKNYNYKQTTQYSKLQQLLKNSYITYKYSLDGSVGDKLLDLLESNLYALSVLLEVATVRETGRCAEEILFYLKAVVSLRASASITCVIQLLKSLFGTNLASNWEDKKTFFSLNFLGFNLFDSVFHLPTEFLSEKIRRRTNLNSLECENLTAGLNRRGDRKLITKNTDKNWLATYIRLFEPMVVKSLQLYTIRNDVKLQVNVLRLLNQLVQLRLNYCLLDAKQVFVGFVLSQFELIEHGQIPEIEELLPYIFEFFILLSYQKQHSKPIISVPKIMQLCDNLMASDQSIQTHCIPALSPVVEDIFLSRSLMSSVEEKELETQREVLLSMLLRLAEFPQIMDLLTLILNETKIFGEKEKWKRWSRQVIDTVIPLASQDRLRIETLDGQKSLTKLMASLSVNVLRPIDPLLKVLFLEPTDYNSEAALNRWLSRVTIFLEAILFVKEDALLNRVEEISPNINLATLAPADPLSSPDPFNVKSFFQIYEPSETMARFFLKVLSIVANKMFECVSSSSSLHHKLSMFFLCLFHIIKSGAFHRITNSLQNLLFKEQDSLAAVSSLFVKMIHVRPMLASQFAYFLVLLNYCEKSFWKHILEKRETLSGKLVQSCGVIAIADYLCDNLSDTETLQYLLANNLEEVVVCCHEIPVKELLLTIQKRKSDWNFFLDTISARNFHSAPPYFVEKLLRLLEISDSFHSGLLLRLLTEKFLGHPRLALSLLTSSIACRQVEFLLTLPKGKVLEQIDARTFTQVLSFFKDEKYLKRHFTLWGLLNKLNFNIFDLNLPETKVNEARSSENLKSIQINENWYFLQVKNRCCEKNCNGVEAASLLSKLSYERMVEVMSDPGFNVGVLKTCLMYPQILRERHEFQEQDDKSFNFENPVHMASRYCLLKAVAEIRKKTVDVEEVALKDCKNMWEMSECLYIFLQILFRHNCDVQQKDVEDVFCFGLICLRAIRWKVENKKNDPYSMICPKELEICLKCCSTIIKSREVSSLLSEPSQRQALNRLQENVYFVINHVIPVFHSSTILPDGKLPERNELDQLEFLLGFIMKEKNDSLLPNYLNESIRDLVVNICRIPAVSSQILKVPESCELEDIELLESFIRRFSVVGWSKRQQFEEIWVALLSVLGFNAQEEVPSEDNGFIVQACALAVEGITTLLKSTMCDSVNRKPIHHGRDSLTMKNIYGKLPLVKNVYENDEFNDTIFHFMGNLEFLKNDERYVAGQLSVEYLWTAIRQISSQVDVYNRHSEEISAIGLDLPSCIHLLTELYNQWIFQPVPDMKMISSSLKSSIVISDMFTDISQFQWLLNFCLRIDEIIISKDSVILPLIILGCCKAGAIVLPNSEVCERIKKVMLKSSIMPCRLAAIRGLLYLLQSYVVCYAVNHTALPPPGSAFQEEANFVTNIVDIFLPVAVEVVNQFLLKPERGPQEYDCCHWSLIFYLLQHYQSSLGPLKDELHNFILTSLSDKNCSDNLMTVLVRGTERLLLTTVIDETFRDQLSKVCLEIISHNTIKIARHGLQLVTILSFLDKRVKGIRQSMMGQEDPEKVMKDMERINVLLEKLKKSYPKEAEVVGGVISYVLMDFSASDVLTKIIQEFLSSHQPHQQILAGLLFKVFERAELSLLEDWVVFSLSSFIQVQPIAMSVWTLNCFFVSASSEFWLRSLFPLVQSRMRMVEPQDVKLLFLSAALFYKQLKQESQKKSFLEAFEKARSIDPVFVSLYSSLRSLSDLQPPQS